MTPANERESATMPPLPPAQFDECLRLVASDLLAKAGVHRATDEQMATASDSLKPLVGQWVAYIAIACEEARQAAKPRKCACGKPLKRGGNARYCTKCGDRERKRKRRGSQVVQ